VPLSDVSGTLVSGTLSKNGQPGGSVVGVQSQAELHVVCVLMVLYAVACDDVSYRTALIIIIIIMAMTMLIVLSL